MAIRGRPPKALFPMNKAYWQSIERYPGQSLVDLVISVCSGIWAWRNIASVGSGSTEYHDARELTYRITHKFVWYFCERSPEYQNEVDPRNAPDDKPGRDEAARRLAEYPDEAKEVRALASALLKIEEILATRVNDDWWTIVLRDELSKAGLQTPMTEASDPPERDERWWHIVETLQQERRHDSRAPARPNWKLAFRVLTIEALRFIGELSASEAVAEFNRRSDFSTYKGTWRDYDSDNTSNAVRNFYRDRDKVKAYLARLPIQEDTLLDGPEPYWPRWRPSGPITGHY